MEKNQKSNLTIKAGKFYNERCSEWRCRFEYGSYIKRGNTCSVQRDCGRRRAFVRKHEACGFPVYNYFPSKSELLLATIESVWMDIFHMNGQVLVFESFTACIAWLFDTVYKSSQKYPEFFNLHSMSFAAKDKNEGRKMMEISLMHLKKNLVQILTEDQNVRENAFENELTPEIFVEYVFTLLMSILLEKQKSCEPLLTMIAHSIYESHF